MVCNWQDLCSYWATGPSHHWLGRDREFDQSVDNGKSRHSMGRAKVEHGVLSGIQQWTPS